MGSMYSTPGARYPRPLVAVLSLDLAHAGAHSQLVPDGVFRARDGRPRGLAGWRLDAAIAERVLARLRARRTPIVVDYEHQTLNADKNGQAAPAAGWIDPATVEYRPAEGLVAPIQWTAKAKAHIDAGEYKFLSPVLPYDARTGEVLDLLHVALTNFPAVDGMTPVAALTTRFDLDPEEDPAVDRTQLITLLGLASDASDEQIQQAITALKAHAEEAAALKTEVAALKTQAPDLSQYVPKAVFDEQAAALAALKTHADAGEIDRLIEDGLKDGRIAGQATADWLKTQGLAALKAHLAGAPKMAALKGMQTRGKAPEGAEKTDDDKLGDADLAVCKAMGIDPEAYRKANAADSVTASMTA